MQQRAKDFGRGSVGEALAGAMDATTGLLTWVGGRRRKDSGLFIELLGKLKEAYAGKRAIHVILDNYTIHSSKRTRAWLAEHGGMAALRRARKVGLIEEAPREMEGLQWGRAPESAEGGRRTTLVLASGRASMGPRSGERGRET